MPRIKPRFLIVVMVSNLITFYFCEHVLQNNTWTEIAQCHVVLESKGKCDKWEYSAVRSSTKEWGHSFLFDWFI